jgi:hypothetical protein
MLKSILQIIGVSLLIAGIAIVLQNLESTAHLIHPKFWTLFGGLAIISLLVNFFNQLVLSQQAEDATKLFLATTVLRLLASLGFAAVLIYLGIDNRITWVLNFFIVYIFYLVFEITSLVTNLRPRSR